MVVKRQRPSEPVENFDFSISVVLIGAAGVGKSSILRAFDSARPQLNDRYAGQYDGSTDMRVCMFEVDGYRYRLNVWECPDMSNGRPLASFDMQASAVAVVYAFDLTNRESFEQIETALRGRVYSKQLIKLLVGTKADLSREREVPRMAGERLAGEQDMLYVELNVNSKGDAQSLHFTIIKELLLLLPAVPDPMLLLQTGIVLGPRLTNDEDFIEGLYPTQSR